MEHLIKGLVDVALGRDDKGDEPNSDSVNERSRSSWAQVVSGDNDIAEGVGDRSERHGRNQLNEEGQNQNRPGEERWEPAGSAHSRRPKKDVYGGFDGDQDSKQYGYGKSQGIQQVDKQNEDEWQTVQKKPQRQTHKVHKDHWNSYKRAPSEQEYADDVDIGAEPSENELSDLSEACNKLWELDINRLVPGRDYEIDCGEGKKVYQKDDMAQGTFFRWVNEDAFRKPTYSRFCSLLDNYNPHEGYKELVTSEERQEQAAFIEEICRTAPIKYLHKYLLSKDIVTGSFQDFKRTISTLWFDLYARGGTSGSSSAFEHVFVGEIKQCGERQISGFHNWLQFYLEEAKGRVDYQGYIFPRRRGEIPDSDTQLLTIQFEWNGVLKSVSSTLIGVSPEFEIALYTLCFYVGQEDNHVQLGPYSVNIKCYRFGNYIGSAFPIADS